MNKKEQAALIDDLTNQVDQLVSGQKLSEKLDDVLSGVSPKDRGQLSREVGTRLQKWRESQRGLESRTPSPLSRLDSYFRPTLGP